MNGDELINHYIEIGAIDIVGVDDDGEIMLKINDVAETIAPELWQQHKDFIDETLVELFQKGLVNVSYDEDLNAEFELTEAGIQALKDAGLIDLDE